MKIGYEAKRIFHNASGLGNYGRNLLRTLAIYLPENEYHLYNPRKAKYPFGDFFPNVKEELPLIRNNFYANIWRQRLLSDRATKDGMEIFHGLAQELPMGLRKNGIKSVVSVHDLIFLRFPHLYKFIDRKIYTQKLKSACQRADIIAAISQQTKDDLIEFLNIPSKKIEVVYQGAHPIYWEEFVDEEPADLRLRFDLPGKFALFVGTLEERKGVDKLLDAQLQNKIPTVYIGRKTKFWKDISKLDKYKSIRNIIFTPDVWKNEDLAKIYRIADVFIYPSIFEGFGIPVLEALISKTPVITSNISSLPEVAGPGSILIDPMDAAQIAENMTTVWDSDQMKKNMAKTGYAFAQKFRDDKIAENWKRIYAGLSAK